MRFAVVGCLYILSSPGGLLILSHQKGGLLILSHQKGGLLEGGGLFNFSSQSKKQKRKS